MFSKKPINGSLTQTKDKDKVTQLTLEELESIAGGGGPVVGFLEDET